VAICGWAGARAAMVLSILVGLMGVACLVAVVMSAYWYWWACVPAIYLGWLGFRAWRRRAAALLRQPIDFSFSLATMFLFVLVVAIVIGGFAIERRGQKVEYQLTAQLQKHPGSTVNLFLFERVSEVVISPQDMAELREIVAILKQLTRLRRVQLDGGANLPPALTVAILSELTELRALSMQGVVVNDADIVPLAKLKRLELLELQAKTLTDTGLPNLYPLKRLRGLWLYSTDPLLVTPAGMQKLHNSLPNWEN